MVEIVAESKVQHIHTSCQWSQLSFRIMGLWGVLKKLLVAVAVGLIIEALAIQ